MRVIEINDMLYKIADRDYTFIKEEVEKYLLREESKVLLNRLLIELSIIISQLLLIYLLKRLMKENMELNLMNKIIEIIIL